MGHSIYEIMKLLQQWPAARETVASKYICKQTKTLNTACFKN